MNRVFWIGVYPGLTKKMLDFVAAAIGDFVQEAKAHSRQTGISGSLVVS